MWGTYFREDDLRCLWRTFAWSYFKAVYSRWFLIQNFTADERIYGKLKDGTDFDWGIEDIPLILMAQHLLEVCQDPVELL